MKSTALAFKDFLESRVWSDIKEELEVWLNDIRDSLEDPDRDINIKQMNVLQGNAQAVRRILDLPRVMYEELILIGGKDNDAE